MKKSLITFAATLILTCLAFAGQMLFGTAEATCSCGKGIGKLAGAASGQALDFNPGENIDWPPAFTGTWDPVQERYHNDDGTWIEIEPSGQSTGDYTYHDSTGTTTSGTYSL